VPHCNTPDVSLFAGPILTTLSSNQGTLENTLFTSLLPGSNFNLSVLDWQGLAQGQESLNALVTQLETNQNLSSPSQVLSANLTPGSIFTAAAQVAQTGRNTALVTALNDTIASIPGINQTIQLGQLLNVEINSAGSLVDAQLNVLNVVTSTVELYNYNNVAT